MLSQGSRDAFERRGLLRLPAAIPAADLATMLDRILGTLRAPAPDAAAVPRMMLVGIVNRR